MAIKWPNLSMQVKRYCRKTEILTKYLGTTIRDAHKREWVVGEPVGKGGFGMIYLCDQKDRV